METPPQLTDGRLFSSWQADVPALLVVVVLGVLYGWGVLRLRRRGEAWPVARTTAFAVLGLGTIVVATMSALAVYDRVLFWPAAVQNVLLDLIAPSAWPSAIRCGSPSAPCPNAPRPARRPP